MGKTQLLFLVILIEGYVVLACELLAMRQLIPFVGSGTDVISIVISAVLLPLAIGYHYGGSTFRRRWQAARKRGKPPLSIRKILLKNILSALAVLIFGLSYPLMHIYFAVMEYLSLHRIAQAFLYVSIFLVWPIFLLGQTVPLVSNYFSRRRLSEITGRMLFFSTAGSFFGSVFSTLVLMSFIGVHATVIFTLALLCLLILLLSRRGDHYSHTLMVFLLLALIAFNSSNIMRAMHIVSDNAYNTIRVYKVEGEDSILLDINRSSSSKFSKNPNNMFGYVRYIEDMFLAPIAKTDTPRDILILGAGGFTIGLNDTVNRYTYVDIDPDLKSVAETYFIKRQIGANKSVFAASARAFVHGGKNTYDLIVIDVFTNIYSIPMEATTREFLQDVKKRLKPGGIIIANVAGNAAMRDRFSLRYNNTFASVFPNYTRQLIGPYQAWNEDIKTGPIISHLINVLYIYFDTPHSGDTTIYTDDRNTYSLDRN